MIVNSSTLKRLHKELNPRKYRTTPTAVIQIFVDEEDDGEWVYHDTRFVLPDPLIPSPKKVLHAGDNSELRPSPLPNDGVHDGHDGVRTSMNIIGAAGKGKSTLSMKFARVYREMFPDRKIVIISPTADMPFLEELDIFIIRGNDRKAHIHFVNKESRLSVEDFEDHLVIFDDIESYADKAVKKGVHMLKDEILMNGRHTGTSIIICGHTLLGGMETKTALSECDYLSYFINGTELSKKEKDAIDRVCPGAVKKIMNIIETEGVPPQGLFTIHKKAPSFVMTYKDLYLL